MPSSSERSQLLGGPTPPRHGGKLCTHCGHTIVNAPVTGVWVHNLTGERACYGYAPPGSSYDTRAEPEEGDDDA